MGVTPDHDDTSLVPHVVTAPDGSTVCWWVRPAPTTDPSSDFAKRGSVGGGLPPVAPIASSVPKPPRDTPRSAPVVVDDPFGWPDDDPFSNLALPLDPGIEQAVRLLHESGVETYESCEGGPGHALPEPTVRFHGDQAAGWQALSVALNHGLPVLYLRRVWYVDGVESSGPTWEMVFRSGQPAPAAAMT